jgi:hypothetical protein
VVKPSDPDAPARRDGYLERRGTWAEVTVGSLIAGEKRTDVWEIIDTANPPQIEYGHTLWFRARNRPTGEVKSIPPHMVKDPVTFLMKDDAEKPPPRTPPADAEQIALLVEKLGAQEIATRNNETGEVTCPSYAQGKSVGGNRYGLEEIEHLRICHGIDVSGIQAMPLGKERTIMIAQTHGHLHGPESSKIPHGGFPHRHIPEDLTFL